MCNIRALVYKCGHRHHVEKPCQSHLLHSSGNPVCVGSSPAFKHAQQTDCGTCLRELPTAKLDAAWQAFDDVTDNGEFGQRTANDNRRKAGLEILHDCFPSPRTLQAMIKRRSKAKPEIHHFSPSKLRAEVNPDDIELVVPEVESTKKIWDVAAAAATPVETEWKADDRYDGTAAASTSWDDVSDEETTDSSDYDHETSSGSEYESDEDTSDTESETDGDENLPAANDEVAESLVASSATSGPVVEKRKLDRLQARVAAAKAVDVKVVEVRW